MTLLMKYVAVFLFAIGLQAPAMAGDRGTPAEATAMVKKAIEYMKTNGRDKAYAEFNNPKGSFRDRDLYIFVYDMKGTTLAHGTNPKLLGKNLMELKDADGTYIVKSFLEVGNSKGKGWVDYKWPNPISKAIEPKTTYVEKYEDVVVGAGVYK
jgi:cytochrome c